MLSHVQLKEEEDDEEDVIEVPDISTMTNVDLSGDDNKQIIQEGSGCSQNSHQYMKCTLL